MLFTEAIEKIGGQTPIGSALNTEQWREVPAALRENAFFSATIEDVRFLQGAKDVIGDFLSGNKATLESGETILKAGSRAEFVKQMQEFAIARGLGPLDPKDAGGLKDIRSETRLSLIFNTKTTQAKEFGYWKQGQDPDVLDEFPAQRFIREADVTTPRAIHQQNEGVVRLKSDLGFWLAMNSPAIGGFGVPWGPWGFNSGMGVEDVDRDEAESLGLISPGEKARPVDGEFNDKLQASVQGIDEDLREQLRDAFGEQIEVDGDVVKWRGPSGPAPAKPEVPQGTQPAPVIEEAAPAVPEPTTLGDVLQQTGLLTKAKATATDMTRLVNELKETAPLKHTDVLNSLSAKTHEAKQIVRGHLDEFLSFFPPKLVDSLPRLKVTVRAGLSDLGQYSPGGNLLIRAGLAPEEARRVMFHELMHWVHREGPQWYRDLIRQHFEERTAGEALIKLPGYGVPGKKDQWYEVYAGRIYPWEVLPDGTPRPIGLEVPTRYIEWLTHSPEAQAVLWNDPKFRETMQLVLTRLF